MRFVGPVLALLISLLSICLIFLPFALSAGAGLIELAYQLSRLMWILWLVFVGVSFLLTIRVTKLTKRLGTTVLWTALFITAISYPARKTPMWLMGLYPINDPPVVTAAEATLEDNDKVLGVVISDQARAYPFDILLAREIVNDQLGGTPLVATY